MAWVKLDDGFPEHAKVIAAGGDAAWLHVCALAYANRNLTDGHIPAGVVPRLSDRRQPTRLAARLVEVGLWDVVDGGWVIHDYLTYQPSREKVEDERRKARDRMTNARRSSPDVRANNERSSPNPDPTRPDPTRVTESQDRQTLLAAPTVGQSVVVEAAELYARAVYERDPTLCRTTRSRYETGIRNNALTEHRANLEQAATRGADATRLAIDVLGVTETELVRFGAIIPDPPEVRAAKRNAAELRRLGLVDGAA